MSPDKLAAMANQIAGFFRSYPDDVAVPGVERHLVAFWTPKMLATLREHIADGGHGVDGLVAEALATRPAHAIIDRAAAPSQAGAMATDAG